MGLGASQSFSKPVMAQSRTNFPTREGQMASAQPQATRSVTPGGTVTRSVTPGQSAGAAPQAPKATVATAPAGGYRQPMPSVQQPSDEGSGIKIPEFLQRKR